MLGKQVGKVETKKAEKNKGRKRLFFHSLCFFLPFFTYESMRLVTWHFQLRRPVLRQLRCVHKVRHSPHWDQR